VGGGLILRWDGTSWTRQTGAGDRLNAVSCPTTAACVAAGSAIDRWSATKGWSSVAAANGTLHGVSCVTTTTCVAVGTDASGRFPLVESTVPAA